ncbi:hypothetical protein Hsar01_03517 [Haloferula sargassicola]|uniref:Uncharacterized protein n=2 Tax=Haloferula sargassicola TaxID=490096 RepID=A0ABP9URW6_9BACT
MPPAAVREAPWKAGVRAARANLVPGLVVQLTMVGLLVSYDVYPTFREALGHLAETKVRWGWIYSGLSGAVAGGVLPELLRIFVFQKGRLRRSNLSELGFAIPFWAVMGIAVDFFYRGQALMFGDEAKPSVVIPQVLVDQFLFTPFYANPVTVWLYGWKNRGYRWPERAFTLGFFREKMLPALIANWGVWIPIVCVIYTLPEPVQIPMFSLALSMWVMLYSWIAREG